MNLKSICQQNLFNLNNVFNEITNLMKTNNAPSKILFTGPKGSGKSTLSYHLINYFLSSSEKDSYDIENKKINTNNKSFKLVKNNSHPNFHLIDLIDDKKNIEISQIRKMINYTNKSTFNNLPKFILIDNIENLNLSSANALLKIIEEPKHNCFFFLIHNNNKKIFDTLKSRCLLYKINFTFDQSIEITNKLINGDILELINKDLINHYNTPGDYIDLINFAKMHQIDLKKFNLKEFLIYLIKENYYKKDTYIKSYIINFIQLYFLKIFLNSNNKSYLMNVYSKFIKKNDDMNKFNLDVDSFFMEFKSKILNG